MSRIRIVAPREALEEFCCKNRIRRLAVFGSAIRDDFTDDSDIDVLVEFEQGHCVGLIGLGMLEGELSDLLGREVDLNTFGALSPCFRDEVLEEAETLYVAA